MVRMVPPQPKVKITRKHFEDQVQYSFEFDPNESDVAVHEAFQIIEKMSLEVYDLKPEALVVPIAAFTFFAMIERKTKNLDWKAGDKYHDMALYPCEWIDEIRPLYDYKVALDRLETFDA